MQLKSYELGMSKNKMQLTIEKFDEEERNPESTVDRESSFSQKVIQRAERMDRLRRQGRNLHLFQP